MAVILPSTINGVPYSAEVMRRNMGAAYVQSSPGVVRSGVLGSAPAVSLSGSTVQVGAFNAVIGTAKGAYITGLDSVTSAGSLGVADATNGRLDRVVLEVLDPDNGGAAGVSEGRLRVVAGTPAALPGLPALPANSLHVAQVSMPRAGAGNPVVTVDCQFTAAVGAPVPVRSAAERDALTVRAGLQVLRMDVAGFPVDSHDGSKWVEGGWDTGHQPIGSMGTAFSGGWRGFTGGGYGPLAFRRVGKHVQIWGAAASSTAEGAFSIVVNMPVGMRPATKVPGISCEMNPDGALRTMIAYATNSQPTFFVSYFAA